MLQRLFAARRPNRRPADRAFRPRFEALEDRSVLSLMAPISSPGGFDAAADFNHDGKADLVVTDRAAGAVSVRLGNGDGSFQPAGQAQHANRPLGVAIAVADFTGDGHADVLTTESHGPTSAPLALFRGQGDGSLLPPVITVVRNGLGQPVRVAAIEAADMTGDGRTDVVINGMRLVPIGPRGGFSRTDHLHVLLPAADGSGSFTQSHTRQINASSIHVADFNGDGRQDVLTIATATASLWLGNGNGTLTTGPTVNQFAGVKVTMADLNGDGKADVIRQDSGGSTSTVFLGKGNGQFTKTQTVAIAGEPKVADVNRDGRLDLVSINSTTGSVSVLLGNGNGKFQAARDFAASSPTDIVMADFDGDGWLDVALLEMLADNQERTSLRFNDRSW